MASRLYGHHNLAVVRDIYSNGSHNLELLTYLKYRAIFQVPDPVSLVLPTLQELCKIAHQPQGGRACTKTAAGAHHLEAFSLSKTSGGR